MEMRSAIYRLPLSARPQKSFQVCSMNAKYFSFRRANIHSDQFATLDKLIDLSRVYP